MKYSTKENYFYKFAKYPSNNLQKLEINHASRALDEKLKKLKLNTLNLSDYNKRYFGNHISTSGARKLNLTKYSYVLNWSLSDRVKEKEETIFVDFGGGHGMMSLLAKQYGIGTVIHVDIFPDSSKDARSIGKSLGIEADYYITGGINELIKFVDSRKINVDSIASYDVIEHIYNIEEFLSKVGLISSKNLCMFHASAANEKNPLINYKLKKIHKEFEENDRKEKFGRKPTDITKSLFIARTEIIKKYNKDFSNHEINNLAKLTRGKIVRDIEKILDDYIENKIFPEPPLHPTNTCDPYTGNWFENLLNTNYLNEILTKSGFDSYTRCGYYDSPKNKIKNIIKIVLNFSITILGNKAGLYLAPFYALHAKK